MKFYPVAQQTAEWFKMRAGIPTASCADQIITPKTLKLSSQAVKYRNQLLSEWMLGTPFESEVRVWAMDVGLEREQEAADYFSFTTGLDTEQGGFFTDNDGRYGASPDRNVSDGSILEIKAPTAPVHVGYLLAGELPTEYLLQVQMEILVSEAPHCWFQSFYPGLPSLLLKIEPIEHIQTALRAALHLFLADLEECKARLDTMRKE